MNLKNQEEIVFVKSTKLPDGVDQTVEGYDFNDGPLSHLDLGGVFTKIGFQASAIGAAITEINRMLDAKFNNKIEASCASASEHCDFFDFDTFKRKKTACTIFLGYTSNIISSGIRDVIRFLTQHNMVDCIVTTAGGVEEDFIKCMAPTFLADFQLNGAELRKSAMNRIGNLLVPNDNYCQFETWLLPILDQMLKEQNEKGISWTPSKIIRRLGQEINNEKSVYFWAYKNNIPVFCPALTDGSLGDVVYFHSYRNPGLKIDILEDLRHINTTAVRSIESGLIILGGGLIKHHICNANMMRNGAEYAVFVNTASEYDGSDAGARPDEAVSWGKIKATARPVKVHCDVTVAFPLIVSETFAKHQLHGFNKRKKMENGGGGICDATLRHTGV